jgi:hypothetical protein
MQRVEEKHQPGKEGTGEKSEENGRLQHPVILLEGSTINIQG